MQLHRVGVVREDVHSPYEAVLQVAHQAHVYLARDKCKTKKKRFGGGGVYAGRTVGFTFEKSSQFRPSPAPLASSTSARILGDDSNFKTVQSPLSFCAISVG